MRSTPTASIAQVVGAESEEEEAEEEEGLEELDADHALTRARGISIVSTSNGSEFGGTWQATILSTGEYSTVVSSLP